MNKKANGFRLFKLDEEKYLSSSIYPYTETAYKISLIILIIFLIISLISDLRTYIIDIATKSILFFVILFSALILYAISLSFEIKMKYRDKITIGLIMVIHFYLLIVLCIILLGLGIYSIIIFLLLILLIYLILIRTTPQWEKCIKVLVTAENNKPIEDIVINFTNSELPELEDYRETNFRGICYIPYTDLRIFKRPSKCIISVTNVRKFGYKNMTKKINVDPDRDITLCKFELEK